MSVYSKSTRASQQEYDGYRDGGGKKETNKTKIWGVRERAYIKAWWIRNSTPSCSRLRRHSNCWEVDRMMSLGTPRHRRPSRNRTSKSSVHGSAAGHDWVRPEPGQGGGCEARRKPRLVGARHKTAPTACVVCVCVCGGSVWWECRYMCATVSTGAGTGTVLPIHGGVGFNGQGTLGSSSKGLVETRHAVAIPT